MSFGTWEGHTIAELRERVGAAFIAAENKGLDFQPPGGESPRAAMARIGRWTASIAASGQPVVAVSHKATIRALLALATGWDMMGRPSHKLDWRCLHFFSAHADGRVSIDASTCRYDAWLLLRAAPAGHRHLRRAAVLARALVAGGFDVLLSRAARRFRTGGAARASPIAAVARRRREPADLAPLDGSPVDGHSSTSVLTSCSACCVPRRRCRAHRAFPFRRTRAALRVAALLEAARGLPKRPLIACSVRDVVRRARPERVAETEQTWSGCFMPCDPGDPRLVLSREASPLARSRARLLTGMSRSAIWRRGCNKRRRQG